MDIYYYRLRVRLGGWKNAPGPNGPTTNDRLQLQLRKFSLHWAFPPPFHKYNSQSIPEPPSRRRCRITSCKSRSESGSLEWVERRCLSSRPPCSTRTFLLAPGHDQELRTTTLRGIWLSIKTSVFYWFFPRHNHNRSECVRLCWCWMLSPNNIELEPWNISNLLKRNTLVKIFQHSIDKRSMTDGRKTWGTCKRQRNISSCKN